LFALSASEGRRGHAPSLEGISTLASLLLFNPPHVILNAVCGVKNLSGSLIQQKGQGFVATRAKRTLGGSAYGAGRTRELNC
jgi:hypothetical protein